MLPEKLTAHVERSLAADFGERDEQLAHSLGLSVSKAAAAGMLGSGAACNAVMEICKSELRARARLALNHFMRAAGVIAPVTEGVAKDATTFLSQVLERQRAALMETGAKQAPFRGQAVVSPSHFNKNFADAIAQEMARIESELDLWEAQLAAAKRERPQNGTTNVTVTGNYNVVQAGTINSTASLIIDGDSRAALLDAFAAIRRDLPNAEVPAATARELEEVLNECEREIKEPKPNKTRLLGYLQAISTAIQTTASLNQAWEVLKGALQMMGLRAF